jgi:DNA uptake protein ComE-like DNA-binding protein
MRQRDNPRKQAVSVRPSKSAVQGIDLNTAESEELSKLPGIAAENMGSDLAPPVS